MLPIKFEIVLEGRIALEAAGGKDQVCGVSTLTPLDMSTSKLLANADRWSDDGAIKLPRAVLWSKIRALRRVLA